MIVVTAPTGQIGGPLVQTLLDRGHDVRLIARDPSRLDPSVRRSADVVEGSHADPAVLDTALRGAEALFWLVPPDPQAASAMDHYLTFARAAATAVTHHRVGHVVGVSSAGHGWPEPAGVLSAAFAMDAEVQRPGAAYRALSMPFYLENLLQQLPSIRDAGTFSLACAADRPLATIATRDVAEQAAALLTDLSWSGQQDLPLFGPDRFTPNEMAEVVGEVLGRPIAYRPMALADFAAFLRSRGVGERGVADRIEMFAAQDAGIYDADWTRATIGGTDLRTWCVEVLKPALES